MSAIINLYVATSILYCVIFFSDEGPRSRRYGRTAALRLLVQRCVEDDDDDDDYDYFCPFPVE
jgi:hypothetical protein